MNSQPRSGELPHPPFEEKYICASCGTKKKISSTQPVLCTTCNGRVFRKMRTKKTVQYFAR